MTSHHTTPSLSTSSPPSSMPPPATANNTNHPLRKLQFYQIIVSILLFFQVIVYGVLLNSNDAQIEQTTTVIANGLQEFMTKAAGSTSNITSPLTVDIEQQQQHPKNSSEETKNNENEVEKRDSTAAVTAAAAATATVSSSNQTSNQDMFRFSPDYLSLSSSIINTDNLWENSTILPQWMKDYFVWHKQERAKLTPDNWKQSKFLIMRCLIGDRCGGTADRIKTVPLLIYWAARTKRLLMIYWNRPAVLEEFLLPPQGGMDWRVPQWMIDDKKANVMSGPFCGNVDAFPKKVLSRPGDIVARAKVQSYNGGSIYYNANVEGPRFETIYHDVWRIVFTPSVPVQKLIQDQMERFHLKPGEYAAAHLRGLYARKDRADKELEKMSINALNCASQLRPNGPLYFASDSKIAVDYVMSSFAVKKFPTQIVALQRDYEPLHLEKAVNWENRTASEYYDTFVDLYLLGLSRCVSYNVGGFGQWGLWLSSDVSCSNMHMDRKKLNVCEWAKSGDNSETVPALTSLSNNDAASTGKPSFVVPMGSATGPNHHETVVIANAGITSEENSDEGDKAVAFDVVPEGLWEKSTTIPTWMKEYFDWHQETKRNLTEANWEQTKYFVMQCLSTDERCGGLSDRIRPMPLMLLIAARSKRLLLIQWGRPFPLEEFLIPPVGGLNWTVPEWLAPRVQNKGAKLNALKGLLPNSMKDSVVLRARYQSGNHGSEYFNNQTDSVTFEEVYHDMFRVVFEPSPPVAKLIETNMMTLGLRPGEYVAAHFRALYGRDYRHPEETGKVAVNAVNCASELRPDGPVFFAADHKVAIDFVKEYASKSNLPVVSLDHEDEPLHLDKDANWTDRSASAYYATFVDLYLLGQSRCMAYSNGGFGTFGLLLSYDAACSVRYFSKKIIKECPSWIKA